MDTSTGPLSSDSFLSNPSLIVKEGESVFLRDAAQDSRDIKLFTVDDLSNSEETMSQVSINVNIVNQDSENSSAPTKPRYHRESDALPGLLGSKSDIYLRMSLNISAFMDRIGGRSAAAEASTSRLENLILNGSPSTAATSHSGEPLADPERMVVMMEEVERTEFFQEVDLSDLSASLSVEDRIGMSYLASDLHHDLRCPSEILEVEHQKKKKRMITMISVIGTVLSVIIIIIVIAVMTY